MDLEQQLREALAPCEPGPKPEAVVMAKISSVVQRKPSRFILVSTILVVAAAAAMLTMQLWSTSAPTTAVVAPASVTASAPAGMATSEVPAEVVDTSASMAAAPVPKAAEEQPALKEVFAAVKPFTVLLLPLRNQATDAARTAVESFYSQVLEELRAVPGLTLVASDPTGNGGRILPDYALTIRGSGPVAGNKFTVSMGVDRIAKVNVLGRVVPSIDTNTTSVTGEIAPTCQVSTAEPAWPPCGDAESLAVSMVYSLRTNTFPPDPSLQQDLQAQLLDRRLEPRQRLKALSDLGALGRRSPGDRTNGPINPAAVRGAINLVADTTDPVLRTQVWKALQGVHDSELVRPLVASMHDDPDAEVRLQALTILASDFPDDAGARSAFEIAAREDARPLVRALARRTLSGDGSWKEYMVSSLKDSSRPVAERVEALMYYVNTLAPGLSIKSADSDFNLLDKELIQALGQVLPQAITLPQVRTAMSPLTSKLDRIDRQLTIDLLLDGLEQSTEPVARTTFVTLLSRRSGDARARAALEKLSSSDADPKLRESASSAIKAPAVPLNK